MARPASFAGGTPCLGAADNEPDDTSTAADLTPLVPPLDTTTGAAVRGAIGVGSGGGSYPHAESPAMTTRNVATRTSAIGGIVGITIRRQQSRIG
ncbi:MAG: hypothetical protein EPO26_15115 [Chloroflexota bacterium]|nr:MAG: hypothetical protein EPO26_15115 [Chloroflexota bacterium]